MFLFSTGSDGVSLSSLHEAVRRALEERGFVELTEPQKRALPHILEGKNVLIVAPTGSGKTEAALLPIMSKFLAEGPGDPGIYILYITPLRALNRDLLDRLKWWGAKLNVSVDVRHGDTDETDRQRQSKNPPHMLITTPEMLQAILTGKRLLEHLRRLRWIIVDEVHELAEDKRGVQLSVALERIRYHVGRDIQIVGLSATVGSIDEVAKFLFGVGRPYVVVQVGTRDMDLSVVRPRPTARDAEEANRLGTHEEVAARLRSIKEMVERHKTTLIFVNTRSMAELLGFRLSQAYPDLPVAVHHSSLSKMVRLSVESGLKSGALKAVVATSSLELGIDIGHVDLVIQYLSPHQVVRLVQRVGRSGHKLTLTPKGVIVADDVNDALEAIEIVKRAKAGMLEQTRVPHKPYDVLANQVAAFLMLKPRWRLQELYEVITRAYPYRDLTLDELRRVVKFLNELRPRLALYFEEDDTVVRPRNRGFFRYFFETLSMIPDEKQYAVVNSKTGELIGTLDEAFVAEYGAPGVKFVFRGRPWLITEVDGRAIKVIEVDDPSGAIPSWIGEEVPVPFEVAQGVGRMKREIHRLGKRRAIAVLTKIGMSREAAEFVVGEVLSQPADYLPDDETIVVEQYAENIVIVHAHLGTLANRALSKLLSEIIIRETELPIGFHQDAYSVILQASRGLDAELVVRSLMKLAELSPAGLAELVKSALVKSGSFKRRFLYVAKRFGAVDKEADIHNVSIGKLVEAFSGTPVFDEALREALEQDLDLESLWRVLQRIKEGSIRVVLSRGRTRLGEIAYEKLAHRLEIIPPERLRKLVLESVKARLLNTSMMFVCADCGWTGVMRVGEMYDARCPKCGGRLGVIRYLSTDNLEKELRRKREEALKTAELLEKYGWKALVALAGRIPLEDIESVLKRANGADLNKLAEAVMEAEREHLKARILEE
ncbi:DEAD/DEAH box helicase [Thermoproteus tenax]|uniref:Large helicase-related protein n=1 Tax=Thermoproteus tenax (strain ATCC 35583 / DSM 2078 / JCM 9277 / NBRC 100435 / Kra 1) TaxID=768679 RepID=G4RKG9_THETK|nr:large helicase-related protein [Thermoproteus tenax Kra 1]